MWCYILLCVGGNSVAAGKTLRWSQRPKKQATFKVKKMYITFEKSNKNEPIICSALQCFTFSNLLKKKKKKSRYHQAFSWQPSLYCTLPFSVKCSTRRKSMQHERGSNFLNVCKIVKRQCSDRLCTSAVMRTRSKMGFTQASFRCSA